MAIITVACILALVLTKGLFDSIKGGFSCRVEILNHL